MYMCVYTCVCIYVCVCVCVCVHTRTHTHTVCTHMHTNIYTLSMDVTASTAVIYVCLYVCVYTHIHTHYTHTHTHTYTMPMGVTASTAVIPVCLYVCVYTHIHTHTHLHLANGCDSIYGRDSRVHGTRDSCHVLHFSCHPKNGTLLLGRGGSGRRIAYDTSYGIKFLPQHAIRNGQRGVARLYIRMVD
jgi:hypothetical protein